MKRILFFILVLSLAAVPASAQKSILFLLPLDANKAAQTNIEEINNQQDIENLFGRTLIHFWEGAQIAISELGDEGYDFRVIVRDVTDATKLEQVLGEPDMHKVDLIIAPVYGKLFPIVAEFGHQHKIPVVNPFTSRHDIIEGNPYIYKANPSLEARAAYLCDHYPGANFILWMGDTLTTPDATVYQNYFNDKHITYHKVPDSTFFGDHLSHTKDNVVITCFNNAQFLNKGMTKLLQTNKLPHFTWIIPEEWPLMDEFNIDNMNGLNVNYFASFFADDAEEHTQVFNYKYGERFHCLPSVRNYAYQGYDIAKFFISLILNDYRTPDIPTIAYEFKFKRIEKGGFENRKARFIHLQNYEFKEVK
ncbi:MAG: hypothetical protein J6S87_10895 [Bacteroidales bacterium]|nr:hypothetical protein [Bacteroidales bacterium]